MFAFDIKDCVTTMTNKLDSVSGGTPTYRPGITNGQSVGGRSDLNLMRSVTAVHGPTGFSVVEDRFDVARNKQIALSKLKKMVEAFIEEHKKHESRKSVQ